MKLSNLSLKLKIISWNFKYFKPFGINKNVFSILLIRRGLLYRNPDPEIKYRRVIQADSTGFVFDCMQAWSSSTTHRNKLNHKLLRPPYYFRVHCKEISEEYGFVADFIDIVRNAIVANHNEYYRELNFLLLFPLNLPYSVNDEYWLQNVQELLFHINSYPNKNEFRII